MPATERDKPLGLGVLVSGRGSNLQAIVDAVEAGYLPARLRLVISDKAEAFALERAKRHGIEAFFMDPKNHPGREAFDLAVADALRARGVELVALAGYMRVLSPAFIRIFPGRVINIHPALLPAFPGLHVQRKALEHGVRFSGCTVHFVDEGVDTGPIIVQAVVPVVEGDTEETLSARILRQEHRVYPWAIRLFAEGRLRVEGRRVHINHPGPEEKLEHGLLINPPPEP